MHSFIRWPGIKSVFSSVDVGIVLSELLTERRNEMSTTALNVDDDDEDIDQFVQKENNQSLTT